MTDLRCILAFILVCYVACTPTTLTNFPSPTRFGHFCLLPTHTKTNKKYRVALKTYVLAINYIQQDRQCTYDVTFSCVLVTLVTVEEQSVLNFIRVCLLSCLRYPACKSYFSEQHCTAICGMSCCTIFFHIISQTEWFLENIIEHKTCVLIFSTTFVCDSSHSKKNMA